MRKTKKAEIKEVVGRDMFRKNWNGLRIVTFCDRKSTFCAVLSKKRRGTILLF